MVDNDILAIVGSTYFAQDVHSLIVARRWIIGHLNRNRPDMIVSGGAAGIDKVAVLIAKELDIAYQEFFPQNDRWEPEGFKERNIQIVEACTRLICIRHYLAKTYGSGWTADHAERNRIPVKRYMYTGTYEIESLQ